MVRRALLTGTLLLLCACRLASETALPPTSTAAPSSTLRPIVPESPAASTTIPTLIHSTATPTEGAIEIMTSTTDRLTITIVYDNNAYDPHLTTAWGFAALVEYRGQTLLFDTGGDGPTLLGNMATLGIAPARIEGVVLSHIHDDHAGGLSALLAAGARPIVYLPPSFPANFKRQVGSTTTVVEVAPGQPLGEGLFTTGEMGGSIPEQALVIRTDRGLVMVTGCAHPGIVQMVAQAKELFGGQVHLVMGGFHLRSEDSVELEAILADFRRLGVEKVAPSHCTGDQAIAMFAAEYGGDFIQSGVGRVIVVE
jgi:7,8-dihydropterin-6-yl-methyl-4-(beta-D-ribofuranosyl)aminobenzene 5'-phosphate synthase